MISAATTSKPRARGSVRQDKITYILRVVKDLQDTYKGPAELSDISEGTRLSGDDLAATLNHMADLDQIRITPEGVRILAQGLRRLGVRS